ncbi:MAG: hypothetical protein ROR55_05940 [Devosia sp.]
MQIVSHKRLGVAKKSFVTRRVPLSATKTLISDGRQPKPGDVVLARVTEIGSHKSSELECGRRATLLPGDEVVLAYGNRYAPAQYEAYVPEDLSPCHMVAAGGIAAYAVNWHNRLSGPTAIEPLGLLGGADGEPLNLKDFALEDSNGSLPADIFAVFGTSMNAGKSALAANLIRGFTALGHAVGFAKITGTGAGGDVFLMRDSGAIAALDFTDAGLASTFKVPVSKILSSTMQLLRTLGAQGCTVAVIEVADGLFQSETAKLAESADLTRLLSSTFFAAGDAMGATAGMERLCGLGHTVAAVSGVFTRSPLAVREAIEAGAPVLATTDIRNPEVARTLLQRPAAASPVSCHAGL